MSIPATTKTVRETEAEAVAFVVGTTIGLRTNRVSADYNFALRISARIIETAAPWFLLNGKIGRQSRDRAGRIHRVWMSGFLSATHSKQSEKRIRAASSLAEIFEYA